MSEKLDALPPEEDGRLPRESMPPAESRCVPSTERGTNGQPKPGEGRRKSRSSSPSAARQAASEADCLAALSRLPALNMTGLIDIKQTNAFKGVYSSLLQYYSRRQASPSTPALDQPGLVDALRRSPELISLLEPFLSDEQIDALMAEAGQDEPAEHEPPKH